VEHRVQHAEAQLVGHVAVVGFRVSSGDTIKDY